VISDQCALPEIADTEAGIVTAPTPDAIIAALRRLIDTATLREKMGQNGRQLVEANFTWKRIIEQYESLYREVIERTKWIENHTTDYEYNRVSDLDNG
jgi:Glycosyltransferase